MLCEPAVPDGVVIVTVVDVITPSVAATPFTVTEVVPVKSVPLMTVEVPPPRGPDVTVSDVIVGTGR